MPQEQDDGALTNLVKTATIGESEIAARSSQVARVESAEQWWWSAVYRVGANAASDVRHPIPKQPQGLTSSDVICVNSRGREPLPIKSNRKVAKGTLEKNECGLAPVFRGRLRWRLARPKKNMIVAARTVGGQGNDPETTPAKKE